MAAEGNSTVFAKMLFKCFALLVVSNLAFSYSYPLYEGRRYLQTVPIRRSSYFPLPVTYHRTDYQLPDYDDEFMVNPQDEYEYSVYDKYPYVQYFGYYPTKDYYREQTARKNSDGLDYFDDRLPQASDEEIVEDLGKETTYPYGQETWYEEELPRYDSNAEANAAFLQNLIMAQIYQNAKNNHPYGYESAADDYDEQHWSYGIPTTEEEEKENVRQYFRDKEEQEVKELESLARKKNKSKKLRGKTLLKKQKNYEMIEKSLKPKSKMTDDEYFDLQKQIIVNNRKSQYVPVAEGFRLSKKQSHDPVDMKNNFWDFHKERNWPSYMGSATNSIKKLTVNKNAKSTTELGVSESKIKVETTTTAAVSSTPAPKRPISVGQKEVVLPRPSTPVRRPFPEISSRSLQRSSIYDIIKNHMNIDKDLQKREISKPQKRFILNEDQLTAELSGLKKSSP